VAEALDELLALLPHQLREGGADRVADGEIGTAAAGAEDHRCPLPRERPLGVPASRSAACAASSPSSWNGSIERSDAGGIPNATGSNRTSSTKPPQRE
jgi:hypothetical protein